MVLNELIELLERIITETKTIKGVSILAAILFLFTSFLVVGGLVVTLFVERQQVVTLLNSDRPLPQRLSSEDRATVRLFLQAYSKNVKSIHVVWYNKANRVIEVIHSDGEIPEGFDLKRPYSLDFDVHTEHFLLRCVSREINNNDMEVVLERVSCPIYIGNDYGVEGYVLVLLIPDHNIDTSMLELHLKDTARTIGQ